MKIMGYIEVLLKCHGNGITMLERWVCPFYLEIFFLFFAYIENNIWLTYGC